LRFQPFVVLMQSGSVGSSWMRDKLARHSDIVMHGEWPLQAASVETMFHTFNSQANSWHKANKLLGGRHASRAFGFKIKLPALEGTVHDSGPWQGWSRLESFLLLLRCLEVRLVCLYRRNWVKHAVSRTKQPLHHALCGVWTPVQHDLERTGCHARLAATPLNVQRFRTELNETRHSLSALEKVCRNAVTIRSVSTSGAPTARAIAYEDLAYKRHEEAEETWAELQRWLGVEARTLNTTTVKMTANNLSRAIVNFDQLDRVVVDEFGPNSTERQLLYAEH